MAQKRLATKVLLAKPTGKQPRSCSVTRWSVYISDLAWSCFCVEPAELPEIAVDNEVYRVLSWLLSPQPSVEEKQTWKWMNESSDYLAHAQLRLWINKIIMRSITITLKAIVITITITFVLKHPWERKVNPFAWFDVSIRVMAFELSASLHSIVLASNLKRNEQWCQYRCASVY